MLLREEACPWSRTMHYRQHGLRHVPHRACRARRYQRAKSSWTSPDHEDPRMGHLGRTIEDEYATIRPNYGNNPQGFSSLTRLTWTRNAEKSHNPGPWPARLRGVASATEAPAAGHPLLARHSRSSDGQRYCCLYHVGSGIGFHRTTRGQAGRGYRPEGRRTQRKHHRVSHVC